MSPEDANIYYNKACLYAIQNMPEKSCYFLELSINKGFNKLQHIEQDKDLDNIKSKECYQKIMKDK